MKFKWTDMNLRLYNFNNCEYIKIISTGRTGIKKYNEFIIYIIYDSYFIKIIYYFDGNDSSEIKWDNKNGFPLYPSFNENLEIFKLTDRVLKL